MLKVYIGGILIVLGMFALFANPLLGGIMIAAGYGLYASTSKAIRAQAESVFWGLALVCGGIVTGAAVLGMLF